MIQSQKLINLLLEYEQATDFMDKKLLHQVLSEATETNSLTFIIFSCIATEREREEIVLDFFRTLFFDGGSKKLSRNTNRAIQLVQDIEKLGIKVDIVPILVDTEPQRTWGWSVPQDELTMACQIMIEDSTVQKLLPDNWKPTLWSELEARYSGTWTFERSLEWARGGGKHALCINQQKTHLTGFSDRYHFSLGVQETAIRQVAAYAFEGVILEQVFPNAILLQSEYPWKEKDVLYQWLRGRKNPLQIIHPFPN